ncbi:MAG: hypothetical protein ACJ8FY_28655 [Gemmataceae bacterium]
MHSDSSKSPKSPDRRGDLESISPDESAARLAELLEKCQQELAELKPVATVGTAMLGIAHELGNCLNSMMLQTSIVQMHVPGGMKERIAALRQQGAQAAALLRPLQRLRQQAKETLYPVDGHAILREVLAERPDRSAQFSVILGHDVPPLMSTRATTLQLFRFLRDALVKLSASPSNPIKAETGRQSEGGKLVFTLEDFLPQPKALTDLFAAGEGLFANMDEIDRLAIQSLLRIHQMVLQAADLEKQGLSLELTWK